MSESTTYYTSFGGFTIANASGYNIYVAVNDTKFTAIQSSSFAGAITNGSDTSYSNDTVSDSYPGMTKIGDLLDLTFATKEGVTHVFVSVCYQERENSPLKPILSNMMYPYDSGLIIDQNRNPVIKNNNSVWHNEQDVLLRVSRIDSIKVENQTEQPVYIIFDESAEYIAELTERVLSNSAAKGHTLLKKLGYTCVRPNWNATRGVFGCSGVVNYSMFTITNGNKLITVSHDHNREDTLVIDQDLVKFGESLCAIANGLANMRT